MRSGFSRNSRLYAIRTICFGGGLSTSLPMPTPPTHASSPAPAGDDRNLVPIDENYPALSTEDRLALFWAKHSRSVIAVLVVVILAVLAKGGYDLYSAHREKAIVAGYAAATTDARLKAFADAYPAHPLSGIARLRLADTAYEAGHYADAHAAYTQAAGILGATPLGQRARLGAATALVLSGKATEGQAALKQIVAALAASKAVRAEAAYQLAELAAEAGQTEEATRLITQIESIDPAGQWTQRATLLRARLPAPAAPADASASAGDKKDAAPAVQFKAAP